MLNSRYIELTSTHRDRTRYPYPSQFTVELSISGRRNTSASSLDPVFNSVVMFPPPNSSSPTTYATFSYLYGPLINGGNAPSDTIVAGLPTVLNTSNQLVPYPLSSSENAYVGNTLELITSTVSGVATTMHEYRQIVDYKVNGVETIITTIDGVEPIYTTSIPLLSTIDCDIDQFFTGWTITFSSATDALLNGTSRVIEYYRGADRRVFFDSPITNATLTAGDTVTLSVPRYEFRINAPFTLGALPSLLDSCAQDDNITFRIRLGSDGALRQGTLVSGTSSTFVLPATVGTMDYTGHKLWITTDPVVYSGALTSASFVAVGGAQVQGTFVLPAGASVFGNNALNNMTITLTSGAFSGYSYLITDWDNATLTGTITPGWTSLIVGVTNPSGADTFTITQPNPSHYRTIQSYDVTTRTGSVSCPFSYINVSGAVVSYAVSASDTFDILQFIHDNYQPLDYPESTVAQQQAHCYEIDLTSLTLPNVPLVSGGRIFAYPYVYVEFRSVTQGTSAYDFNSNNPVVAKNIMFRAPIMNSFQADRASFFTFDGHGMRQVLKFKPNDAFRFAVYLPNGDLFLTEPDYVSPSEPNPKLQITACFGVYRLK